MFLITTKQGMGGVRETGEKRRDEKKETDAEEIKMYG